MKFFLPILLILITRFTLCADHKTAFYYQRLNNPEVDPRLKLEYADSLLADKNNNTDSLLQLKIKWAHEVGNHEEVIDAYEKLGYNLRSTGIAEECSLRLSYILSLANKNLYVRNMSQCLDLIRLNKPDSLIYYDALAYSTIHDFIRQSNIPFREDYIQKVKDILEYAKKKNLPHHSVDRIKRALHAMRMKTAIIEKNYDTVLEEADSLLKLPMTEYEKESLEANMAYVYMMIGQYDAAENYFLKILNSGKTSYNSGICLMNYTHMLNLQGKYQQTLELINKYDYAANALNKDIYYSHLLGNKAIAQSHTIGYEKAYQTLLDNKEVEDSLYFNSGIKDGLLLFDYTSKMEKISDLENSLSSKSKLNWILAISGIVALIIAATAIGIMLKKNRQNALLKADLEKYGEELQEKERIEASNIQNERGKLAAQLLQFAKIEETMSSISDIASSRAKSADERIKQIREVLSIARTENDTREIFERQFEQAHSQFFKKLFAHHPDLSSSEARLCAYLIMNLSTKEIASVANKTTRSIESMRYRIGKKLNIPEGKTIVAYLREFL